MKKCYRCKIEKIDDAFAFRNKSQGLRARECKECHSQLRKLHYENNKQKIINQVRDRKIKLQNWYQDLKMELECGTCGESHPATLQFHHLDPEKKDSPLSEAVHRGWGPERIRLEMEKCLVLCANCHFKEHWDK
jgi:hypothetical protein